MSISLRNPRHLVAAVLGAATLAFAAAPAAHAGVLVKSASNCPTPQLEQPFRRWLDNSSYMLAPAGSFESGTGKWSLARASVDAGNESFNVHGDNGSHSLKLTPGGSAVTGTICVGLDRPTLRFFARSSTAPSLSTLAVSVRFETSLGLVVELPIGVVLPGTHWAPSIPMPIVANLLPLLPGQMTPVQFRFTPLGTSSWWVDDVYVDPKSRS
jgi:hypothetical protein